MPGSDDDSADRAPSSIFEQIKRLAKHSAIYGVGGLVSRIVAVLLLPLYTRYLTTADYGAIETLVALSAVLFSLLRAAIASPFFRFYFDSKDEEHRTRVVRTAFWFTMATATGALVLGLALAGPIAQMLFASREHTDLVRAAFVGLWAQMNYDQLTSLFRVEERSLSYALASVANVLVTIGLTILLVVVLDKGPLGVIVGNFAGTLAVYVALLLYRRYQLGLQFDTGLFGAMMGFGLPFVPSVVALTAIDFSDRFFLIKFKGASEVGQYSVGVRISAAILFFVTAFRTAWPAFAYSIEDDDEARRTYSFVLTYLLYAASWLALAFGLLSPWLVHLLTTANFYPGSQVVAPLAFSVVALAGYVVVLIGVGRARRTRSNWIVTAAGAAVNVVLNVILIPPFGMMGAAISTVAAYAVLFLGMTWKAQLVFPVSYQWRRIALAVGAAVALTALGKALHVGLAAALVLIVAYPFVLLLVGFYLPAERQRLKAIGRRVLPLAR